MERETQSAMFFKTISEVISHDFCHILSVTWTNFGTMWERITQKGVNIREQGFLGAILEAGYHMQYQDILLIHLFISYFHQAFPGSALLVFILLCNPHLTSFTLFCKVHFWDFFSSHCGKKSAFALYSSNNNNDYWRL